MAAFSDFYDLLLPELKGCTTAMVDLQLIIVARDFCTSTSAWRNDFDQVVTVASVATYDLDPSEFNVEVVRVQKLTVDDVVLFDEFWTEASDTDEPTYKRTEPPFSISPDGTEITLIDDEIPSAAGTLDITGSLRPILTATTLPDFLLTEHTEAIRTGVLARLMRMGGKPWTDRPLAAEYLNEYTAHSLRASGYARAGNTKRILRTTKGL